MNIANFTKTTRYELDFYTNRSGGSGMKDALKNLCPVDEYLIAICCTYKHGDETRTYSEYAICSKEKLEELLKDDKQLFEVMHNDRSQKIAFDIDFKGYGVSSPLPKAKDIILSRFPNAELSVSGGIYTFAVEGKKTRLKKYSYHILLNNYYADCTDDLVPVKELCVKYKHLGFDPNLYKKDGLIKCINQSKGDGRLQLRISGSESIMDHTVMHNIPETAINIKQMVFPVELCKKRKPATKVGGVRKKQKRIHQVEVFPYMGKDPEDFDIYSAEPLQLLQKLPNERRGHEWELNHDICTKVARWCKYVGISFEKFWEWNKQRDDSSSRLAKYQRFWSTIDLEKGPVSSRLVF